MITVQQILFRQGHQFSCINKQGTFQRTSRRKGPTGSTRALIFNWRHSTHGNPVDFVRTIFQEFTGSSSIHGLDIEAQSFLGCQFGKFGVTVRAQIESTSKLVLRHVRELIVAQQVSGLGLLVVVSFNAFCLTKRQEENKGRARSEDDDAVVERRFPKKNNMTCVVAKILLGYVESCVTSVP